MPEDIELQNTEPEKADNITVKLKEASSSMKEARRKYEEAFSIHGLGHAMNSSMPGRVLWSLCVLGALIGVYVLNVVRSR